MGEDADVVIGSFAKNKREEIRITLSRYKGFDLVGLRVWFRSEDGSLRPGKSGFNIRTLLLPELVTLLQKAEEEAKARGLLGPGLSANDPSSSDEDFTRIVGLLESSGDG